MDPNFDFAEYHVTVRDYFTRQPIVDSTTGLSTMDLPYESCELVQTMYEPRKGSLSNARIVLPSLIRRPELRPLLQRIREGARVEIFDFQPDCGDPRFAGFIPQEGIQQNGGKVELSVVDSTVQGQWQRLRRAEQFNDSPANLYGRALSHWVDIVNEDFALGSATAPYYRGTSFVTGTASTTEWDVGAFRVNGTTDGTVNQGLTMFQLNSLSGFNVTPQPGDTFMLEAFATLNQDWHYTVDGSNNQLQTAIELLISLSGTTDSSSIQAMIGYDVPGANPPARLGFTKRAVTVWGPAGGTPLISQNQQGAFAPAPEPAPQVHALGLLMRFTAGTLSVTFTVDNAIVIQASTAWAYGSTLGPQVQFNVGGVGIYGLVSRVRFRRLVPYLGKAARFVPQTKDPVYYVPNNEDSLSFLNLLAEKDNTEYRVRYHAWPQPDEIELDALNTLGTDVSATLGYDRGGARSLAGAGAAAAPAASVAEVAQLGSWAPPMRLEEGWNMTEPPRTNQRANPHANDVFRMGSGTTDAQPFAELWSVPETGNPVTGASPVFPYFENITNDDRIGVQAILTEMVKYDLAAKTDGVPSMEVNAVIPLIYGRQMREGDWSLVRTLSLLTNVEQSLRIMQITRQAGSPVAQCIVGHLDRDPAAIALLQQDMVQAWLFEQSGSSPTNYVYPFSGTAAAGTSLSTFSFAVDRFTSGSAIVGAYVHWWTSDTSAALWHAVINGAEVPAPSPPSSSDSGVVDVTYLFASPGQYSFAMKNTDAVNSHTLKGAYLMVRIKV